MNKKFGKALVWLAVHITAFVISVWFFMGIKPIDTYYKTTRQLSSYVNSVLANVDMLSIVLITSLVFVLLSAGAVKTLATICAVLVFPSALTSMLIHRGVAKWYLDYNPTKYKKINFRKGVTENEE